MMKMAPSKNRQFSIITLFSIVMIASLIFYFSVIRPEQRYYYSHHVKIHGIYLLKPIQINDFALIDIHNKTFTKENLKNHWTLLYFGFTHCSMVCPVTMDALNQTYKILQKKLSDKNMPEVVLVSVDPERDTIKRLNNFVTAFNPHFNGARGTAAATIGLEKQLHVITIKKQINKNANNYDLNHSAEILLVNPDAKIQAYFTYPPEPNALATDYQSILRKDESNKGRA